MEYGIDTYVTIAESDSYINGHYRSSNPGLQRWSDLEEPDKEVLLVNACAELELLQFQGRKALLGQPLAFPRLPYQYGHTDQGAPTNVKAAQIELALWLSDDKKQAAITKRQDLQSQGVGSFSVGDLSESYVSGGRESRLPLLCPKVAALLRPYLNGGRRTC